MSTRSLCGVLDLAPEEINVLFEMTRKLKDQPPVGQSIGGRALCTMFFQPSTRTRLGYERAARKIGLDVFGFADVSSTRSSVSTAETLEDTARVCGELADIVVIRHHVSGAAYIAATHAGVPVVNGGDGSNEHPTQALIDAWVISERLGGISGAKVGLVGDPGARVLRSLALLLSILGVGEILFLVPSPSYLIGGDGGPLHCTLPIDVERSLRANGTRFGFRSDVRELLDEVDAIDMMPIDFPSLESSPGSLGRDMGVTPERFRITRQKVFASGRSAVLLHPGPRKDELHSDTDELPNSAYFEQVNQGVNVRAAVLQFCLGM